MALVKFAPDISPLIGEHTGFTFQNSRIGSVMFKGQANDRHRYSRQINRKCNITAANSHWRNMSEAEKANWNTFAAEFPEPTKRDPEIFLTGYQLFCKRQSYVFLNGGFLEPWLLSPLAPVNTSIEYSASISSVSNCLDVTELYIANFGILPQAGDHIFIKIIPYQAKGGRFFNILKSTIEVQEVYIDGLFVSLSFPATTKDIIFSVFLSQPVSKNRLYQHSQIRYMGCFTVKSFLELTDTPDSYTGQAGKIVKVNASETGLEFGEAAGGSDPSTITSVTGNTTSEGLHTHELNETGVTAGTYNPAALTVDSKGRITYAANASLPTGSWSSNHFTQYYRNITYSGCISVNVNDSMLHYVIIRYGSTILGHALHLVTYNQNGTLNSISSAIIFNTLPDSLPVSFQYSASPFKRILCRIENSYGQNVIVDRSFSQILQTTDS